MDLSCLTAAGHRDGYLPISSRPGLGVELVDARVHPFLWATGITRPSQTTMPERDHDEIHAPAHCVAWDRPVNLDVVK
jgi:hypothetical protein